MFQDKDQYTYYEYMLYVEDNLSLEHIQGGILDKDRLDILANTNIFHYHILHLSHTERDYKDHLVLVHVLQS